MDQFFSVGIIGLYSSQHRRNIQPDGRHWFMVHQAQERIISKGKAMTTLVFLSKDIVKLFVHEVCFRLPATPLMICRR
jgi:hypothetical protein